MEFWLKQTESDKFRLPVNPESFSFSEKADNTSVNVNKLGEVNLLGYRKLKEGTMSSFFPNKNYNFSNNSGRHSPYWYVTKILGWKEKRKTVRVIIGSNINVLCTIEAFQYGEQDGTGDVYFTLQLKEYRAVSVKQLTDAEKKKLTTPKKKPPKKQQPTKRPANKPPSPRTYTVKRGDCLWNIAKKFYGNGAQYIKIYNANRGKIKNPNLIYPGQVLTIP